MHFKLRSVVSRLQGIPAPNTVPPKAKSTIQTALGRQHHKDPGPLGGFVVGFACFLKPEQGVRKKDTPHPPPYTHVNPSLYNPRRVI